MPAEAPAAPAGVTIIDTPPPGPPPAPTTTIRVSEMPKSVETPAAPNKPGSAKERMFEQLRAKAKGATPPAPPEPKSGEKPGDPPPGTKPPGSADPDPRAADPKAGDPKASDQTPPVDPKAADPKDGKTNPWKLVDQYKSRAAELEKELANAKTNALAEQQRKEYLDQIQTLQKRRDELENEIRFVDYSKSEEFRTKYQKPYEEAWQRAASELEEIVYNDPQTREARKASAEDLMQLINLPLAQAREVADAVFGKFADDVMAHRKELRTLFSAQSAALKEAREKGAERAKQQAEMSQKQLTEINDYLASTWAEVNKSVQSDPKMGKWFTPVEGDQEGNSRLAKGFEMVDRAFSENPADPRLTKEQRADMIKRHAAVRNRAAAFGRIRYMYEQAETKIAELEKELAEFKKSTPTTGGGAPAAAASAAPASAKESVFAALRKLAK